MPQALKKYAKNVPYTMQVKFMPATEAELKELGEDLPAGYIAGWASTPDLDSYRHIVKAGAFNDAIKDRGLTGPKGIRLLLGHDWDKAAGKIKRLEMRGDRLWIEGQLNLKVSYVSDAYELIKDDGGWSFSVGFMLQDYEFKENEDGIEYLHILRGDLYEVSVVPFPANEECTMTFIKSRLEAPEKVKLQRASDFEKMLVDEFGIASRQVAHKITLAVKSNLHLFGKSSVSDPASEPTTPLMPEGTDDFRKALAVLKKTLQDS
jgi:HK97 family phage prohead protease